MQVNDAGLDHGDVVLGIDPKNLAHARHLDNDAGVERECAAGKAGACAAWCEGNVRARELTHDGGRLVSRRREDNGARAMFVLRQPVTLVDE